MSARRLVAWTSGKHPSIKCSTAPPCFYRYSPGSDSWEKAVAARGALPLTVEVQLLLSVEPKQPIWDLGTVPLATAILPQCCPSSHPALAMLSSATSSDVEAEASFLPASGSHFPIPLPQGALTRWAAGLHARSRPRHSGYNGSRVHGAREWAPLWSNPTLQLNSFPTAALCHGLLLHRHTPASLAFGVLCLLPPQWAT